MIASFPDMRKQLSLQRYMMAMSLESTIESSDAQSMAVEDLSSLSAPRLSSHLSAILPNVAAC